MKEKGFSYNTINNHKRSLKASFYIAIQDDCVRKNPFDFKLSEVLENDTKEKVALTEEQGYYIETPKTKSGTRQVPLSRETIQAFQRVMKKRPKAKPFVIDGRGNFLFVNHKGKPQRQSLATYHTAYTTPYILHKAGKQEHEPEEWIKACPCFDAASILQDSAPPNPAYL